MSGGGIFNANGEVIGVHQNGAQNGSARKIPPCAGGKEKRTRLNTLQPHATALYY